VVNGDVDQETARLRSAANAADPTGRLAAYMARSQTLLNLLALLTVWLVVVPPGDFGQAGDAVFGLRITLSVIYGIDMTIRAFLAKRHLRYLLANPLGVAAVVIPPLRVIFSLRLVRSVFRRGHLVRFLVAASVLVLNGAAVVYLYERHAPGSNIHTFGDALWWSLVTVTTVGYGDYYPVTTPGRIAAVLIMFIGILTLAVVTANVASSFFQSAARQGDPPPVDPPPVDPPAATVDLVELVQQLARIEAMLKALGATDPAAPTAGPLGADTS
jgi:voltage-gated potassium channel